MILIAQLIWLIATFTGAATIRKVKMWNKDGKYISLSLSFVNANYTYRSFSSFWLWVHKPAEDPVDSNDFLLLSLIFTLFAFFAFLACCWKGSRRWGGRGRWQGRCRSQWGWTCVWEPYQDDHHHYDSQSVNWPSQKTPFQIFPDPVEPCLHFKVIPT